MNPSLIEREDYELEVGSAGIGQPFKVLQQYRIHIGCDVEVLTKKKGENLLGFLRMLTKISLLLAYKKEKG